MPFVSVIVAKKYYEKLKRKILHKIICNLNYFRKKYNFLVNFLVFLDFLNLLKITFNSLFNHRGGQGMILPVELIVLSFKKLLHLHQPSIS